MWKLLVPASPVVLLGLALASTDPTQVEDAELREAIERSIPLLQSTMDTWLDEADCVSCHHQFLGTMTVDLSRERGFEIDEELYDRQLSRFRGGRIMGFLQGNPSINGTFGRGFQAITYATAGVPRDVRTDALGHYLIGNAVREGDERRYRSSSYRPPLEASPVTGAAIAVRGVAMYHPDARGDEAREVIDGTRRWLERIEPKDAEERAMRLFGLAWAGASDDVLASARDGILAHQLDDGGWAQLATMESDAYATGQALTALAQAGGVDPESRAYLRGLRYLLDTQHEDGSWLVKTRRRSPGLPYFETGFPHALHQFISTAATCWAVMALGQRFETESPGALMGPRPPRETEPYDAGFGPVFEAAAFGGLGDLEQALDADGDPNEMNPEGMRPLHVAIHDREKVALLLLRGAEIDPRDARNGTPLMRAAWYHDGQRSAELLLASGAAPNLFEDGEPPMPAAAFAAEWSKPELLRRLVDAMEPKPDLNALGLHYLTTAMGDTETTELLIELGVDPDVRLAGETVLQWATMDGETELVQMLLARGANPDVQDEDGMTPLAWAAKIGHGHGEIVEALLEAGADPTLTSFGDRTPLDWARKYGNEPAIERLEAAMER